MAYLNRISYYKSSRNCDNELKVFKLLSIIHIQMLATDLAIMWRQYVAEPIYCVSHMPIPGDRKDCSRILGYHYIQNFLSQCGISNRIILLGETSQLYFLFTFKGSH